MNFVDERVSVGIEIMRSDTDGGCDEVTVTLRRTQAQFSILKRSA